MFFIILVIVLGIASFCFGKYTGYVTIKVKAEIANPKFSVKFDEPIQMSSENSEKIYNFKVINYESNESQQISEVDLEYFIEIISNTDSSIKYELYKDEELIEINDQMTSNNIKMEANSKNEHNYSLKVIYDKTTGINNSKDIVGDTKIKVYCKQINVA